MRPFAGLLPLDRIDVRAIDALPSTGDQAFTYIGTSSFSAPGQIRSVYNLSNNTTRIEVTIDADQAAEMAVVLNGQHQLSDSNFLF